MLLLLSTGKAVRRHGSCWIGRNGRRRVLLILVEDRRGWICKSLMKARCGGCGSTLGLCLGPLLYICGRMSSMSSLWLILIRDCR